MRLEVHRQLNLAINNMSERNSKAFNPPYLDYDMAQVALVKKLVGLRLSFIWSKRLDSLLGDNIITVYCQ